MSVRTRISGLCLVLAFGTTAVAQEADEMKTIHVAPDGSDDAEGTRESPFRTLERARDAVRRMKNESGLPEGGVTVELARGVYERVTAFELSAEDSGTAASPVTYRARPGAEARVVGGRIVEGFGRVRDYAVLGRLERRARFRVRVADLKKQGVTDYGELTERGFGKPVRPSHMELFFKDKPMTLARWPNDGYSRMTDLPDGKDGRRFNYEGDRPKRWVGEPDVWVYGYWYHDWADTYMKVKSIDAGARVIETVNKHGYGFRKGHRWHVLNVLAELDSPGEYYVDREKGLLYFWPPEPLYRGKAVVSVAEKLVVMKDVSHVTVRGLILEACRGTAVEITGGSHCQVVGCVIRNTGNRAAVLSGSAHAIVGCDVYETGDGGVFLNGGDRKTLTPAEVLAENNHIHHFSRWSHTYRPAVGVSGCGNVVRHNLLHHGPHNAILLGGNDHLIEFNEIHSVCCDTGDVGAYYMGRDWAARGTVIRHNYFHHIAGPGRYGAMGVYLDDQASGIRIFGNVFYHVTRAMFIGGGCDNVVENNVFVDCRPAVHIDARGLGWQKKATDDPNGTLRSRLRSMPVTSELWRRRYPNLPGILKDDPGTPKRNVVRRNICVGGKWENIHRGTGKFQTIEKNLLDEDPQFVDPERQDYRLEPTSPAFELGFEEIPLEKIGLYRDDRRASWPVRHKPIELPPVEAEEHPKPPGPAPVFTARRSPARVTVDGRLGGSEWRTGGAAHLVLKEDLQGDEAKRKSRAWVRHDGRHLYVAFENDVSAKPPLRRGHQWGQDDAVEIAVRNKAPEKATDAKGPIIVLRGYVDDTFESSDEPGSPAEAVRRARQGVEYAARVVSPTRWTAEWKIPFESLGVDPAKHRELEFNLSVRKTADNLWLMWRSTRGNTWWVGSAGVLRLAP